MKNTLLLTLIALVVTAFAPFAVPTASASILDTIEDFLGDDMSDQEKVEAGVEAVTEISGTDNGIFRFGIGQIKLSDDYCDEVGVSSCEDAVIALQAALGYQLNRYISVELSGFHTGAMGFSEFDQTRSDGLTTTLGSASSVGLGANLQLPLLDDPLGDGLIFSVHGGMHAWEQELHVDESGKDPYYGASIGWGNDLFSWNVSYTRYEGDSYDMDNLRFDGKVVF